MEFGFEKASFDGWIFLRQLSGLGYVHTKNRDSPQLTRIAKRERASDGEISLLGHLLHESVMPLNYLHKLWSIGVPMLAALHQHERILLHSRRLGRSVNGARVDHPRPVQFGGEPACLDRRIAIRPGLRLRRGFRL